MPATATGPLIKAPDLAQYLTAVQRLAATELLAHAAATARHAVELLESPDVAGTSFRALCDRARVEPYAPLVRSLPTSYAGYAEQAIMAQLTPVASGWILTGGAAPGRQAASLYRTAKDRAVTGPVLEIAAVTGYPTWLTETELAAALGVGHGALAATPAQIRRSAGHSTDVATAETIRQLRDGVPHRNAKASASHTRTLFAQVLLDAAADAGADLDVETRTVLADGGALDAALERFRTLGPDPEDAPGAVALAQQAMADQVRAHRAAEQARAERHRQRAARGILRS